MWYVFTQTVSQHLWNRLSEERSQKKLADTQFAHPRAYSLSYLLIIDGKYFTRTMHQCR